jgi:hypothetical protein
MAFAHHDDAIIPFNDTDCFIILENGLQCSQKHCKHVDGVCELAAADEADNFKICYCEVCRLGLFENLLSKTEDMRREKIKEAKETGKELFVATGFQMASGSWEYEHVTSKLKFLDDRKPETEEIIQACGDSWLLRGGNRKPRTVQTTLKEYFRNHN